MYRFEEDEKRMQIGPWHLQFTGHELHLIECDGRSYNLPVVFFDADNNIRELRLYSVSPTKFFFKARDADGCFEITTDGVILKVQTNKPLGIMWPALGKTYLGELVENLDFRFTRTAYWGSLETDDPTITELQAPVVTHKGESCLSLCFENDVQLTAFLHAYHPYCNARFKSSFTVKFCEHASRSECLVYQPKTLVVGDYVSPAIMKQIIFGGSCTTLPNSTEIPKIEIKTLQQTLAKQSIDSTLIGSSALMMHEINCPVHDIDMLVGHLPVSVDGYEISKPTSSKWSGTSIRLNGPIQADLSCLPDINLPHHSQIVDGIQVLKLEDLFLLKLVGQVEYSLMNPWNTSFSNKNLSALIVLLTRFRGHVYPFFMNYLTALPTSRFRELTKMFETSHPSDCYAAGFFPFEVNTFESGSKLLISVINLGEPMPARIYVKRHLQSAEWHSLYDDGELKLNSSEFGSQIDIDNVRDLGVIACQ